MNKTLSEKREYSGEFTDHLNSIDPENIQCRRVARIFRGGGVRIENEDTNILGGFGDMFPWENFRNFEMP